MTFQLDRALELLERTPTVLQTWLGGLSDDWTAHNEGGETWSPYDVVGHLIHGERTDWISRLRMILEHGPSRTFDRFNRFAQFEESRGKSLPDLLSEFAAARAANIATVRSLQLSDADLDRTGTHPQFGEVTLRQLLATWAVHDMDHVMQVARVMATQIGPDVGPWVEYLRILRTPL